MNKVLISDIQEIGMALEYLSSRYLAQDLCPLFNIIYLKGQCHEILASGFLHGSFSPEPLMIPIGPFQIFQKFAEIFAAQGTTLVSLTPVANEKNLQSEKFSLFLLDTFE